MRSLCALGHVPLRPRNLASDVGEPTGSETGIESSEFLKPGAGEDLISGRVVLGSTVLLFLVPQIHKQFSCRRTVTCIVIVAERENLQDFGVAHQRFENLTQFFKSPVRSMKNEGEVGVETM